MAAVCVNHIDTSDNIIVSQLNSAQEWSRDASW